MKILSSDTKKSGLTSKNLIILQALNIFNHLAKKFLSSIYIISLNTATKESYEKLFIATEAQYFTGVFLHTFYYCMYFLHLGLHFKLWSLGENDFIFLFF